MKTSSASQARPDRRVSTQPSGVLLNRFVLIVAAVLLILAAWAGQTVVVIMLGLGLAAAGTSLLWSRLSLKSVTCERRLTESRAFPGSTLEFKLRVVNRKLLPLAWLQISDQVPAGFTADQPVEPGTRPGYEMISRSSALLWYSAVNYRCRLLCRKRGYYRLGPLQVTSGDVFGFYPRTATEEAADHIIVYPRIFNIDNPAIPSLFPVGEARSSTRIFEDPARLAGIRDYAPGDSLRRIHWKASARRQQLEVKIFEPTTSLKVAIFLAVDSFQVDGYWQYEDEELGISAAASLSNYLIEKKSQVGLWVNSRLADTGEPARLAVSSGVDQLVLILEALAKTVSVPSAPLADFVEAERQYLTSGTTLVFILRRLPDRLVEIMSDLRAAGHRILVFQVGEVEREGLPPGTAWYQVQPPGKLIEIVSGEIQ